MHFDSGISKAVILSDHNGFKPFIGSVGILDGRIACVKEEAILPSECETWIDGSDRVLMPGFVNAHCHGDMTLAKGFGDDLTLDEQNRARSGNETSGSPINTLLPNGNGGVLKPTRIATQTPGLVDKPNAVVEHRGSDGSVTRYFYDDQGKVVMRLDNSDHGQPKLYPFGNGGAHYNRAIYDKRGQFKEWSEHRCITAKMRRLCKDIITDTK